MTTTITSPRSLRVTRVVAVTITSGVGAASFALSFTALRDLATRGHIPPGQAWLWPLMVDGAIVLATLGVVVMAGDPQCRNDRRFFWMVLAGGAGVSIACNALHAILPADHALNPWLRGFLAGVAPTALLVTTHGLTLLTRMHRRGSAVSAAGQDKEQEDRSVAVTADALPDEQPATAPVPTGRHPQRPHTDSQQPDRHIQDQVPADSRWHAIAPRVLARVSLKDAGHHDVAQVLYWSYERTMTNREIGRSLKMSHHTVGKIQTAAAQVLREDPEAIPVAS